MSVYDDPAYMFEAGKMLDSYSTAICEMNAAARAMLALSKAVPYPDKRRRYDRAHKKMVRLIREWNQIEHEREAEDAESSTALLALEGETT